MTPLLPSTGAPVRDHRNAVRNRSESLAAFNRNHWPHSSESALEKTSLSEYLLPKALTIALYCNHRFGATIGALTALFEQTLTQWLEGIRVGHSCVYDPQCYDHGANCHACTHLAETSCRFFNLNLSRAFMFGGPDRELGAVNQGYFHTP